MEAVEPAIYLDYQATTPVDSRVLEAMHPYFSDVFGNAASAHVMGQSAKQAVEAARVRVAGLVGASAQEIVFTSGATEANNLALKGVAARFTTSCHFVTCETEHKSVLEVFQDLQARGHRVTYLPVDQEGRIDLAQLEAAMTEQTVLVSVMTANNEIGTIHPIQGLAAICRNRGVLFHTDAAQAVGKIPLDLGAWGVDLASLSSHKVYGPKGMGALFVRRDSQNRVEPMMHGGGQERGLRSGTANVPGCVGFGEACRILADEGGDEAQRIQSLTNRLERGLAKRLPDFKLNGPVEDRLAGNLSVYVGPSVPGDALVAAVDTVALATGSACTSDVPTSSHVLRAIGLSDDEAECSVRLSVGRFTTEGDIDRAVGLIAAGVARIQSAVGAAV